MPDKNDTKFIEDLKLDDEDLLDESITAEDESKEEDSEEDEEGKKGKAGSGGKQPIKINPKELDELISPDYDSDDEKWLEKLKAMALGPFSTIIPGASAFDAESDLKKKLLIGQVGVMTKQITPSDIANPNLVKDLEARLMVRQEDLKAMAGRLLDVQAIKIATATGILGASAAAMAVKDQAAKAEVRAGQEPKKSETPKQESKAEQKIETKSALKNESDDFEVKDKKAESKADKVAAEPEEIEEKKKNPFATDMDTVYFKNSESIDSNLMDLIKDGVDEKRSFAATMDNEVNTGKPATKPTGDISLNSQFNKAATETITPVESMKLKQDATFKINEPHSVLRPDPDKFIM